MNEVSSIWRNGQYTRLTFLCFYCKMSYSFCQVLVYTNFHDYHSVRLLPESSSSNANHGNQLIFTHVITIKYIFCQTCSHHLRHFHGTFIEQTLLRFTVHMYAEILIHGLICSLCHCTRKQYMWFLKILTLFKFVQEL
jgi:hypothetical protein